MKRLLARLAILALSLPAFAAPSILDIKHSITDDNIIAPESFETKSRDLRENFYLKNFTTEADQGNPTHTKGTPEEYEELLSRLPAEIELPYNSIVGNYIDMYLGKRRDLVADMLALHNYYGKIFVEELLKENLPLELQYLPVIESAINPNAVSKAGAAGLWQFMPGTAMGLGLEVNSLVDQRRDPRLASRQAARYLKQLFDVYGDWSLAIAAYNCGPGNVNKALRRAGGGKKDYWEIYEYLLPETRGYVPAFIAANFVMNYYDRYGIRPTLVKQQLVTDTVGVNQRVHFNQIAEVLNIPVDEIRLLNPQFSKDIIPGDNHPYALVLPSQQCLSYIISEKAILNHDSELYSRRTAVEPGQPMVKESKNAESNSEISQEITDKVVKQVHTVGRGENLRDIARKYGVSATDLKRWNHLTRGKVKEGDQLVIETYQRELPKSAKPATTKDSPKQASPAANSSNNLASNSQDSQKKNSENASATNKKDTTTASRTKDNSTASKGKAGSNNSSASQKGASGSAKSKTGTSTYEVKKGDTLEKIARTYGTTVSAIQKANNMGSSTRINIAQKLKIPQGTPATSTTKKSGGKGRGR